MSLPKITVMKHELTLPSTGTKITFRPFLVKEEKILMMSIQSGEAADMVRGLKEIVQNCVETKIDVNQLPSFDLEYIFLQLRARSVGDKIPISYTIPDETCEKGDCQFETEINIDEIKVEKGQDHKDLIDLTDKIKLKMKYPEMESTGSIAGTEGQEMVDKTFNIIGECIEYIIDGEEMYKLKDYTKAERDDFLNSLTTQHFKEIQNFFDTMPKMRHEVVAFCKSCKKENKRVLEGLGDFFG
tara:strand:+ start:47 stop:772 length:726 start_codon:yes stop_codon:yes gene_type:complete